LYPIHGREICFTDVTVLDAFFHVAEVLNPFTKPMLKSTNHFITKKLNHKKEIERCHKNLILFVIKISTGLPNKFGTILY